MKSFRQLYLLLTLSILSMPVAAQVVGGMNFKMEKLFMAEKYEDVAYKGIKMVDNDKYKKDPEIYLYIAMAWYEISQMNDEKMQEEYPKALRDAFKYTARFIKKDKDGTWAEDNSDFFDDLRKAGIADADQWIDNERKRRNAVSTYKYLNKAVPDDWNILFFKGVLEYMNHNVGEAERNINVAMANLIGLYENPKYRANKASAPVLEDGLLRYADLLMETNYADSAKKTIGWAVKFFPDSKKVAAKAQTFK